MTLFIYKFSRTLAILFMKIIYRPKIIGEDNIIKDGPVILVGNHTSKLDAILLIGSTKKTITFLGKHLLFKGIGKYYFKALGVIPVNRTIKDKSVIPSSVLALEEGKTISIFPEGTINKTDDVIMPFKIGAVKIAKLTGVPIVPLVINGKYKIFGNQLEIKFLKPITIIDEALELENEKLMNIFRKELENMKEK